MKYSRFLKSAIAVVFLSVFSGCGSDKDVELASGNPAVIDVDDLGFGIAGFSKTDFNLPDQDENGFTLLEPSENSKFVYVHPTQGNDQTGQVYLAGDPVVGSDPINPVGNIAAFASIAAAFQHMRDGQPDWMLLASGENWEESLNLIRGKSAAERAIFTAYGSGERPQLRTGAKQGIPTQQPRFVIVSGIHFWAHTRDEEGPFFSSYDGSSGFRIFTRIEEAAKIRDVLIEDCVFRSYETCLLLGEPEPNQPMERVALRRNLFSRNYAVDKHSQGIYHDGSNDDGQPVILLEGNTFDHNGWRIQSLSSENQDPSDGQATWFNHNLYFSSAKNVVVQGNFFLRGSSAGNKWRSDEEGKSHNVLINNNLYFDNEVALSIGGNFNDSYRFQNFEVINNVITDMGLGRPTNRELGWGIDFNDVLNGIVDGNIITRQQNPEVTTVFAIAAYATSGSQSDGMRISNNIVYNIQATTPGTPDWGSGMVKVGGNINNVQVEDNQFFFNKDQSRVLMTYYPSDGINFSGNEYFSSLDSEIWFAYDDAFIGLETWQNEVEETADRLDPSLWPAPERNIDTYISSLGMGSTNDDFINALYQQSKNSWDSRLTAPAVNAWIRDGFGK